jgi:hypothetical protein
MNNLHFTKEKIAGFRCMLLILILACLLLGGCATISVVNETGQNVRIVVHAPDSDGIRSTTLHQDSIKVITSIIGGPFFIALLPDQTLINELLNTKAKLQASLVSIDLTQEEAENIRSQITDLQKKIQAVEAEAKKGMSMCTGTVMEFGSVYASVYTDKITGKMGLTCRVEALQFNTGGGQ